MTITAPTKTSDFSGFLNAHQAAPIFDLARKTSVVQSLVRRIPLGTNGEAIPVTTSKPTAGWVAEGAQKPASKGAMTLKTMSPQKLAVIVVNSMEVVRADPGGYVTSMQENIAEAFALAFDLAALHDMGPDGTGGAGPFSTYIDQTTNAVELGTGTTMHNDIVAGLAAVVADGHRITGFALDDLVEPLLLDEVDGSNRPIYTDVITDSAALPMGAAREGRLIGRRTYMQDGVATPNGTSVVGYGGDWSQAAWGVVGGISYGVSDQATVTIDGSLVSLWENNLVAIRAEAEYGFLVNDTNAFVKFTNAS